MLDALITAAVVFAAAAFLVWRFRSKPAPPACGAVPDAKPQVIVGATLSRALQSRAPRR